MGHSPLFRSHLTGVLSVINRSKSVVIGVGPVDGLGAGIARKFAAEGHHVLVAGRTPLIYDWDVATIELETTPITEMGRMRTRDRSRRGWREVDDTKARSGAFVDEFVLHCARLDNPPRR